VEDKDEEERKETKDEEDEERDKEEEGIEKVNDISIKDLDILINN
jgi:hypothetical protein